jgi:hypothetical protein
MPNQRDFPGVGTASASYAVFNPMDLYMDDIYSKSVQTVPYMSSLSWLKQLKRTGSRKAKRSVYSFYEEGQWMKASAKIAAISSAGGGLFNLTVDAASHVDIGGVTDAAHFFQPGMMLIGADGVTTARVQSVTKTAGAHVFVIKPWNASQDIATNYTVGSTIIGVSNAQKERSGKTESRIDTYEKITNKFQIIREFYDTTDVEAQNQLWFENTAGQKYTWYQGIENTAMRFEFEKEAALLATPQAASLTDASANEVNSAYGMIPQIRDNGITIGYQNQVDGATFDELILAIDNNYGDRKNIVGHATEGMLQLKDYLKEFGAQGTGNISFSPFPGGATEAVKLNMKAYLVGDFEFYFNNWSILSHRDSFGAITGYKDLFIVMPAGMTMDANPEKSAGYVPYIQLVHPEWGFAVPSTIDRGEYLMWETGALAQNGATNDVLERGVHMTAYVSLEMRCRHKFALLEKD